MTNPSEQRQIEQLREELAAAQADTEQIRKSATTTVGSLKVELRLYRGLFWSMLAIAIAFAILKILAR